MEIFVYNKNFSYFVQNDCNDSTKREQVVEQLEASNHWMEAASLAMLGSSYQRSLKIASNALNIFNRKS